MGARRTISSLLLLLALLCGLVLVALVGRHDPGEPLALEMGVLERGAAHAPRSLEETLLELEAQPTRRIAAETEEPVEVNRDRASTEPVERWLRIVDSETGEGIAELFVGISFFQRLEPERIAITGDSPVQQTGLVLQEEVLESAEDGLVRLSAVALRAERLWLHDPIDPSRSFAPDELEVDLLTEEPELAPRVELVRIQARPFRGRLVDATSGAPVGMTPIAVSTWESGPSDQADDPGSRRIDVDLEWVATDSEGRFETPRHFPAGLLSLTTHLGEEAEARQEPGAGVVDVPIELGPIVLLDFDPPPGLGYEDFVAGVFRDPEESVLADGLVEPGSPFSGDWAVSVHDDWNVAPVHAGSPAWARLSRDSLEQPLPAFVALVSRDGTWFGFARFDSFETHARQPLPIRLERHAALCVRITWPGGSHPGRFRVLLQGLEPTAEDEFGNRSVSERSGEQPWCVYYRGLSAGLWRVQLTGGGFLREVREIEVVAGELTELAVTLVPLPTGQELEGRVRTESGRNLDGSEDGASLISHVRLAGLGELAHVYRNSRIHWSSGVGSFRFSDLPSGEYVANLYFGCGWFPVTPDSRQIVVPGRGLEFVVHDEVATETFLLVVRAGEGGEAPELACTWMGPDGRKQGTYAFRVVHDETPAIPDKAWALEVGPYPAGGELRVRVTLEGHRLARLEPGEFGPADERGRRRADVTLRKGWGARLDVQDEEGEPIPGIVLSLDGAIQEPSDERGHVHAEGDEQPSVLRVETAGWVLVEHHSSADWWGTVFPETGEITFEDGELDVVLRPE